MHTSAVILANPGQIHLGGAELRDIGRMTSWSTSNGAASAAARSACSGPDSCRHFPGWGIRSCQATRRSAGSSMPGDNAAPSERQCSSRARTRSNQCEACLVAPLVGWWCLHRGRRQLTMPLPIKARCLRSRRPRITSRLSRATGAQNLSLGTAQSAACWRASTMIGGHPPPMVWEINPARRAGDFPYPVQSPELRHAQGLHAHLRRERECRSSR